jgi:hypothetical protein
VGYYVQLVEADFTIPESQEVLDALRAMPVKYKEYQRGGDGTNKWFSWMSDEEIEGAESVRGLFEALGFDCRDYGNGTFSLDGYDDKTRQEEMFLAVVAPFVAKGSYTQWRGEDGELYRFTVDYKGHLTVQTPREIQWGDHETLHVYSYAGSKRTPFYAIGEEKVNA